MMNKYALGTVLGTALIGIAKSKLGSSIKMKIEEIDVFKITYANTIPSEEFEGDDLAVQNMIETGQLTEIVENKDIEFTAGIDDIGNWGIEMIYKGHYSPPFDRSVSRSFDRDINRVIEALRTLNIFIESDNEFYQERFDKEKTLLALNEQTGEWEIYKSPELSKTKLRKR